MKFKRKENNEIQFTCEKCGKEISKENKGTFIQGNLWIASANENYESFEDQVKSGFFRTGIIGDNFPIPDHLVANSNNLTIQYWKTTFKFTRGEIGTTCLCNKCLIKRIKNQ